jgi:hypothetical protein
MGVLTVARAVAATAGTARGLGNRVGHPEIVWAKLEGLSDGARIASRALGEKRRPAE